MPSWRKKFILTKIIFFTTVENVNANPSSRTYFAAMPPSPSRPPSPLGQGEAPPSGEGRKKKISLRSSGAPLPATYC